MTVTSRRAQRLSVQAGFNRALCEICAISEICVAFRRHVDARVGQGLDRPRFKKQTQIAQARGARSRISQIGSACRDHSAPRSWLHVGELFGQSATHVRPASRYRILPGDADEPSITC
jgi:hypothetical protein